MTELAAAHASASVRDNLSELGDLLESGAGLRVYAGDPGSSELLFSAPLAPVITADPWDALRFVVRPLVATMELTAEGKPPAFALQDCRLRGIPGYGHFIDGTYQAKSVFEETIVVAAANDDEQTTISLWVDYLASLNDEDRESIEAQEAY